MTATAQRRAFELLTNTENQHAGQVAVALHREGLVSSVPSRHTVARGAHSAAREAGVRIQGHCCVASRGGPLDLQEGTCDEAQPVIVCDSHEKDENNVCTGRMVYMGG